jgi:hydroxymethylglutaryl-CoA lyase
MKHIAHVEVGARDGLQNERAVLPVAARLDLISRLIANGARRLEVASFVDPARVPQMHGAEEIAGALQYRDDVIYIGLVLNKRGALRALEGPLHELGAVVPVTDGFGMRNQGKTAEQALAIAGEIGALAKQAGRRFQITLSVAFGCPFEGEVAPARVIELARAAARFAPLEITIADTIGVAGPGEVARLIAEVAAAIHPIPVRAHFHDTRNTALANVWAAIGAGASVIDSSVGGLGGCPFAPGAAGNVATEDVAYALTRSGITTGLDTAGLIATGKWLETQVGHPMVSALSRAPGFPPAAAA